MATHLSFDIISTQILPKLPPISLARFKCVSNSFKTLISSPQFIHTNTTLLVLINTADRRLYTLDFDSSNFLALRLPLSHQFDDYNSFLLGTCNGLISFLVIDFDGPTKFSLLNPLTSFLKETILDFTDVFVFGSYACFGFGYDTENDDYKLVRIVDYFDDSSSFEFGDKAKRREVVVYSSKTGYGRKLPEILSPLDSIVMQHTALLNNSLLHFVFWSKVNNKHRCGCFDVCSEEWRNDTPLPSYSYDDGKEKLHDVVDFGVFDGCLCLLTKDHLHSTIDVWVMSDYGVKESWVQLLRFSDSIVAKSVPIGYGKGSKTEILVVEDDNLELVWYNLVDKTTERAVICGVDCVVEALVCKGSLVTV